MQAVGISKPFFYGNYYSSLAELVIHIINYEITLLLREVQQSVENQDMSLEEMIHHFLDMVTHSRQHHFFVMTQEDQVAQLLGGAFILGDLPELSLIHI